MQSGPPAEDLHAILSRFHTWAGKDGANGNGKANGAPKEGIGEEGIREEGIREEGIREIPYEEAIRQHRSRQAARNQRRPAGPKTKAAPAPEPAAKPTDTPSTNLNEAQKELPLWVKNLPVIPDTEPVIELKAGLPSDLASEHTAPVAPPRAATRPTAGPHRAAKASVPKGPPAAKTAQRDIGEQACLDAFPKLPARAFVDLPSAPPTQRSKPQRRAAAPPARTAQPPAAAVQAKPAPPSLPSAITTAITTAPSAKLKPPVSSAKAAPEKASPAKAASSGVPGIRQAKPADSTVLLGAPAKCLPSSPVRRHVVKKKSASPAAAAKGRSRTLRRPAFRKVLASTMQQPKAALAPASKPAPDRTRRITTRFSPAEERRIERCATELGITVSAYLRQCALFAVTQKPLPEPPESTAGAKKRKAALRDPQPPMQYAAPAPSFLGGWLALLRNRFLGPSLRFSEDA